MFSIWCGFNFQKLKQFFNFFILVKISSKTHFDEFGTKIKFNILITNYLHLLDDFYFINNKKLIEQNVYLGCPNPFSNKKKTKNTNIEII